MDKKLPNVFANPIDHEINNVQDTFYSDKQETIIDNYVDVETEINKIFRAKDHIYRSNVLITTEKGASEKTVVGRTDNSLLTLDNETIPISIIRNIKKIN